MGMGLGTGMGTGNSQSIPNPFQSTPPRFVQFNSHQWRDGLRLLNCRKFVHHPALGIWPVDMEILGGWMGEEVPSEGKGQVARASGNGIPKVSNVLCDLCSQSHDLFAVRLLFVFICRKI